MDFVPQLLLCELESSYLMFVQNVSYLIIPTPSQTHKVKYLCYYDGVEIGGHKLYDVQVEFLSESQIKIYQFSHNSGSHRQASPYKRQV